MIEKKRKKKSLFRFNCWNGCIPRAIDSVSTENVVEQVRRSLIIDNFVEQT